MPNSMATISSSDPISERKALSAVSEPRIDSETVSFAESAAAQSGPPVTASTVAYASGLPVAAE